MPSLNSVIGFSLLMELIPADHRLILRLVLALSWCRFSRFGSLQHMHDLVASLISESCTRHGCCKEMLFLSFSSSALIPVLNE